MSPDHCVEHDTSAVALQPVLPTHAGPTRLAPTQQWRLALHAPHTTAQQRELGLLAALAAFESAGLSPAAASTAPRERDDSSPSPAQTRAIAIWAWAARAARGACYSHTVAPAQARLYITAQETCAQPPRDSVDPHHWAATGPGRGVPCEAPQ